jgi:hypothetical protein
MIFIVFKKDIDISSFTCIGDYILKGKLINFVKYFFEILEIGFQLFLAFTVPARFHERLKTVFV